MKKVYHSLRFRVTIGVLLPLVLILSGLSYARHTSYQSLLLANLRRSAADAGEIIEGGLQHAMVTNDFSLLQELVNSIGTSPGVLSVFLVGKEGNVLISSRGDLAGLTMDISEPTCQACHQYEATSRNESVVLALDQGTSIFRNVNDVENQTQCQVCHGVDKSTLGLLISDFDMAPIESVLATDRRRSILWTAGSILLTLFITNVLMSRLVVRRLERLAGVTRRISAGYLDQKASTRSSDEIGDLASSLNQMVDGLKEKARLEENLKEQTEELQDQTAKLSTLNALAATLGHSLDLTAILDGALDTVLELLRLRAGWVVLREADGETFRMVASRGLPEDVAAAQVQCAADQCMSSELLEVSQPEVIRRSMDDACPAGLHFRGESLVVRTCVPLSSKDRVLGVMCLTESGGGGTQEVTDDTLEMLSAIGHQIGIAVENASLYEELRQKEMVQRQLLERVITVQEEERKRISRELHDQTGQPLTYLIMALGVLGEPHSEQEIRPRAQDLRDTAAQILKQVHDLALELRPSVLSKRDGAHLQAQAHERGDDHPGDGRRQDIQVDPQGEWG